MRSIVFALAAVLALPAAARAQEAANIVHANHRTIEFLGLSRWTVPMIRDSLAKYAPNTKIERDACAAVLRAQLHFADAAQMMYVPTPPDSGLYVVVALVEPQDSSRIHYRTMPTETLGGDPALKELTSFIRTNQGPFQEGLSIYHRDGPPEAIPAYFKEDSAGIIRLWALLTAHRDAASGTAARTTLREDPNMFDRMAAAAILSNFPENDSTWWSLIETTREMDGFARNVSAEVLQSMALRTHRKVDWGPVVPAIHAMLDGTSLFMTGQLMSALDRVGVGPELAGPFLRQGGHAVLMYAASHQPDLRTGALTFLRTISGKDYGSDIDAWKVWIASL
ncbi:MAG: hypothetical protein ACHQXA_04110 [Gemmatimonadales bacterium]